MIAMRQFILIACLTLFCISNQMLRAQMFPARQYTTSDELANSNVYDIAHDNRGYLWFATERGLSRFDGYKFTNYLFKEGVEGAIVYSLANDNKGNLHAATKYDGVYKLAGNFHKVIEERAEMGNEQVAISGNFLYSLKDEQNVTAYHLKQEEVREIIPFGPIVPCFVLSNGNDTVFIATNKGVFYSVKGGKAKSYNTACTEKIISLYCRDGILYAAGEGAIYRISKSAQITIGKLSEQKPINRLLIDEEGRIWCATFPENTLYLITGKKTEDISKSLGISGTSINKILEDNEGNIWIGTYGKGVFCIHHMYCTNYTTRDGLTNNYITSVFPYNGTVLVGTFNGLHVIDSTGIHSENPFNGQLAYIRKISRRENINYVTVSGIYGADLRVAKSNLAGAPIQYLHASTTLVDGDDLYYNHWDKSVWHATITGNGISEPTKIFSDPDALWTRVNALFKDRENNLWIGTTRGLYILDPAGKSKKMDSGFFKTNITSFMQDDDGEMYVGTDHGLAVLINGKWTTQRAIMGKNIESITGLAHDNDHRIWISTLNGLFLLDKGNLVQFDARNTLLSDEINALAFDPIKNAIWVGTTFGLSCIDVGKFDVTPVIAPAAIFKTMRAADSIYRDLGVNSSIDLPYTSKNLSLRFSAIQFSAPEGIKFMYKFDDGPWEPIVGRQIEFASIAYGEHVFQLKSIGERGVEGPVATLTMHVTTPFWATALFKLIVGLAIAGLAYLLLRKRFEVLRQKQQEKLELQSKVAELRHQALSASMNPHFIFNALNSIQHFINSHNTEEATDYLGKFARLIRMMLDYGGRTFIPLKDELERIEYYLDLEKARFGDKLNYTITVDDALRGSAIEIPNMVIQPVVENALWHGLLPANRKGNLNIRFTKVEDSIKVTVDDDGIGLIESKRRKKTEHNSLGIQMIRERLELLNRLSGYKAEISIKDKSELTPAGQGTIAEIRLL